MLFAQVRHHGINEINSKMAQYLLHLQDFNIKFFGYKSKITFLTLPDKI